MLILGIESSCDDTAAAVLEAGGRLLSSIVSSQDEIHSRFGGIVPELASRRHLEAIEPIVSHALKKADITLSDINLIAATQGPGLTGSLLVGFSYAKALSYVTGIPAIGVDHMTAHLLSVFLEKPTPTFPYIALIASGGTTSLFLCLGYTDFKLLGRTRDDAAGEAFDKVARMLDLGYPGGPAVTKCAEKGNPRAHRFPRAWLEEGSLDFSFSGLKTAVFNQCQDVAAGAKEAKADICASFQEAVVEVLVAKTLRAAEQHAVGTVVLGGGVSANARLRQKMLKSCDAKGLQLFSPHPSLCTDNGAMIALAGYHQYLAIHKPLSYEADVFSRSKLE